MPTVEEVRDNITTAMPDAEVDVRETKGGDHFAVEITSSAFNGLSRIEQHRKVYASLQSMLDNGGIHALSIKTQARGHQLIPENPK